MIHVLCLNPAIDKIFEIDGFTAGEDYPGQRPRALAGGKGVNAARVLSQLGEQVRLYAFMGEESERLFRREMESRCECVFIPVPGACRTTINVIDNQNRRETVITEAGPQVSEGHVRALMDALEEGVAAGDRVLCSGSVIAGAPEDIYARVSRLCQRKGAQCALDCNAKALPASLRGAAYALGKPNERELAALLGEARTTQPREIWQMAKRLMPPYSALLVSMGAEGGVLATRERALYARMPQRTIVSTVGSGDAAFAGAMAAMARGADMASTDGMERTLRLAMACGLSNAMTEAVGSVEAGEAAALMEEIYIEEIG